MKTWINFQNAFDRFTNVMNVKDVKTFHQLELEFESWADRRKWIPTAKQTRALFNQYNRKVGGWYFQWGGRANYTSRYFKRINRYMSRHPQATLREARGHRKR